MICSDLRLNKSFAGQFHIILAAGDGTAIVVAEHRHRFTDQVGPEHAFARNVVE